jgi:hypothetical protein
MNLQIISVKDLQATRLKTCMECDQLRLMPIVKVMQCRACGCPIKTKIQFQVAKCPKGKW